MATRWRRWSRPPLAFLATAAVVAVGVVSESVRREGIDVWLPDLAVGICLAISGAVITTAIPRSRLGLLLELAALAWFLPNFRFVAIAPLAAVASGAALFHRAVLFHAIVSFPGGRIGRLGERVVVGLAYVTVLGTISSAEGGALLWSIAALLGFAASVLTRTGTGRDAGVRAMPAMVLLSAVVGGSSLLLLVAGNHPAPRAIVHAYEAGIAAVGVVLAVAAMRHGSRRAAITGAAVELTQGRIGYVRDLLAEALLDPSVEVAFAVEVADGAQATTWVDELGRPIAELRASGSRSVIPILVDGRPVALLACESAVADEPAVRASLEAAARLAARNARLRAGLRNEAERIQASQLRLLSAADDQRIALARELARGAGSTMTELTPLLEAIPATADPAVRVAVERSRVRVDGLEVGIRSLAAGLGPPHLRNDGLEPALRLLGEGFDGTLDLDVRARDLPDRLALAAWFVCAEGIANAIKHARARTVSVTVEEGDDRLLILVVDDGVGGAAIHLGSGLQGVDDRVSALGGSLAVVSPSGEGTRLEVDLPLD